MRTNVELYTDTMICLKYLLDITVKKIDADFLNDNKNNFKLSTKIKRLQIKEKQLTKYEFIFKLDRIFQEFKLIIFQLKNENTDWVLSTIFRINLFEVLNSTLVYFKFKNYKNHTNFKTEISNNYIRNSQTEKISSTQIFKSEQLNDNKDSFVFKTPYFTEPFIDSTQEFSYLAPTQFFCLDSIKKNDEFEILSFSSQLSLDKNYVATQVLEDDDKTNISVENKNSKLIKKVTKTSDKILDRKFINFNPNYNNLNPIVYKTGIFTSQQIQSQAINSKISSQLSININPAKPVKKKSFITIGLSKKQKIKNHLHNI